MMLSLILTLFQYPGRENVKITSPKGKRKNAKKNNLKQEEKITLKTKKQEQEIKTIINKDHVQGLKI